MADERILIVDDEVGLRKVLKILLSKEGYAVSVASSGADALELLDRESFHAVITDIKMPGMSGIELLANVRRTLREIVAARPDHLVIDHTISDWFTELGLPAPEPVPALPLDHQIAQKLHACTLPDNGDWTNDRSHDLVDVQIALDLYRRFARDCRIPGVTGLAWNAETRSAGPARRTDQRCQKRTAR